MDLDTDKKIHLLRDSNINSEMYPGRKLSQVFKQSRQDSVVKTISPTKEGFFKRLMSSQIFIVEAILLAIQLMNSLMFANVFSLIYFSVAITCSLLAFKYEGKTLKVKLYL